MFNCISLNTSIRKFKYLNKKNFKLQTFILAERSS